MNYGWLGPQYAMIRPSLCDPEAIAERDRQANARLVEGVRERLNGETKWPVLRQPCEVPAHVITGKAIPGRAQDGARGLVLLAERSGWRAQVTMAEGLAEGSGVDSLRPLISYAVRLAYPALEAPRLRAVCVWVNGQVRTCYRWTVGTLPSKLGVTELREWIETVGAGRPVL